LEKNRTSAEPFSVSETVPVKKTTRLTMYDEYVRQPAGAGNFKE